MRYEVRSQDDERVVTLEAVDWMMAMSAAISQWNVRVSGWSCSTRANGDVHVHDPGSGRKWVVSPLRTETSRRPLRRGGARTSTAAPAPPRVGKSLAAPPPPAVRSLKPSMAPPASPPAPPAAEDAPPLPTGVKPQAPSPEPPPRPVAAEPKLKHEVTAAPVDQEESKPILRAAPGPHVQMPTEPAVLPDYGAEEPAPPVTGEYAVGPVVPLETAAPSIAKEGPPQASGAVTLRPENLAERLFELADEISEAVTAYEACELTLDLCMDAVKCEAGSILRGSLNDQALTFVACAGPAGDALVGRKLRFGRGIVGFAFDMGFTIVVNDVDADERHLTKVDDETGFHTKNVLCTPIRSEDEHFGILQLLNVNGGFQGWHVQVAESLAQSLAAALAAGLH
ncbi:MAG: GAF domain-containing protein [Proteobacteria bacterium]|nr:GAF domain-containing protein [Pseudomonadota bacterium]